MKGMINLSWIVLGAIVLFVLLIAPKNIEPASVYVPSSGGCIDLLNYDSDTKLATYNVYACTFGSVSSFQPFQEIINERKNLAYVAESDKRFLSKEECEITGGRWSETADFCRTHVLPEGDIIMKDLYLECEGTASIPVKQITVNTNMIPISYENGYSGFLVQFSPSDYDEELDDRNPGCRIKGTVKIEVQETQTPDVPVPVQVTDPIAAILKWLSDIFNSILNLLNSMGVNNI